MNIYLIGYRGTGKTTLGRILAERLQRKFVDTDDLIVENEGRSIPEIFAQEGEAYFRQCETRALRQVAAQDNLVVSTGGGIILADENRSLLIQTGYRVYLTADLDVIYQRIYRDSNRPALTDKSPREEIAYLLNLREPFYREVAQLEIDTGKLSVEEGVERIIQSLK